MRIGAGLLAAAAACTLAAPAAAAHAGAALAGGAPPALAAAAVSPPPTSAECLKALGVACYWPRQLQRAYGLRPLYTRGYSGRGRTIVIVDPIGSPTIGADLTAFDRSFGLPAPPASSRSPTSTRAGASG